MILRNMLNLLWGGSAQIYPTYSSASTTLNSNCSIMFFPNGDVRNSGGYIDYINTAMFSNISNSTWVSDNKLCLVLNPDKITPVPQMYTMNYVDLQQISACEHIEQGFGDDQRTALRKLTYRQTFTNDTDEVVTINTLGLAYTYRDYSAGSNYTLATRIDLDNDGRLASGGGVVSSNVGILLAVEPLDTPITLQKDESKTFQMTFQLTE